MCPALIKNIDIVADDDGPLPNKILDRQRKVVFIQNKPSSMWLTSNNVRMVEGFDKYDLSFQNRILLSLCDGLFASVGMCNCAYFKKPMNI